MTPDKPALEGGTPVRESMLPYGRQAITDEDVEAVATVLRGDWLTTGPTVEAFESALREATGAAEVVAVSSGTAALHAACATLRLQPGDEVIVPALTFVASANAVLYVGGRPVFAEVDPQTLLLDAEDVRRRIGPRTRAVMLVHYAGLAAAYPRFRELATEHGLILIEDAAHALGARSDGIRVGEPSELAVFSFHPVKHITTAEGGAIATRSVERASLMRTFRNHGITTDVRTRERLNTWRTEMVELGYNYRLSDVAAALGLSQLRRLPETLTRRRALARRYREALAHEPAIVLQQVADLESHAWHIFPIVLRLERLSIDRDRFVAALRAERIGANVHYQPVHLQPFHRAHLGTRAGDLPITEDICARLVTLPLFPTMSDRDLDDVVTAVRRIAHWYRS